MANIFGKASLTRRGFLTKSALAAGTVMGAGALLDACGSNAATTTGAQQPVTLKFMHWIGTDAGPSVAEIIKRFQAQYPNITVQFSSLPTDQYETVLKAHLTGGDAPDIFGVFPGLKFYPYAKAGYLADLSNEEWVPRLLDGSKRVVTYNGKVYSLPTDEGVIGVTYNKAIFSQHGISVPTTWSDFLAVCQKLKSAGVTPLALGTKDLWVDQLIPYSMAPSAIYAKNISFDQQMFAGTATFATSPWAQMMKDYVNLNTLGYFNQGILGTGYNQTTQLIAAGKAAMIIEGSWVLTPIRTLNPGISLGMFPLPYVQNAGDPIWVSSSVGATMGVSSTTKYPTEARKFLEFWASKDIEALYLKAQAAFSPLSDVANPALDPAAQEMVPALKVGSYNFLDQNWPVGVQDVMLKDIQGVFAGSATIPQMLQDMDKSFQQNKAAAS